MARSGIGQIAGRAASCASSSAPPPPPSPVGRGRRRRMSLPATGTQTRALESRALQRRKAHRHGSSKVAPAPQRVLCGILDGYGPASVKTLSEYAARRLFRCLQVDGMPPHSNGAEGIVRSAAKRYMAARVQFKGARGMDVGSRKTAITANAWSRGMGREGPQPAPLPIPAGACSTGRQRRRRRGCPRAGQGTAADDGGRLRESGRRRHGRFPPHCRRRGDGMTAGCGPRRPAGGPPASARGAAPIALASNRGSARALQSPGPTLSRGRLPGQIYAAPPARAYGCCSSTIPESPTQLRAAGDSGLYILAGAAVDDGALPSIARAAGDARAAAGARMGLGEREAYAYHVWNNSGRFAGRRYARRGPKAGDIFAHGQCRC